MADLRDKMERERNFSHLDVERLAGLERALITATSTFYYSLPVNKRPLYGESAGTPKTSNCLEYSKLFDRYHCISLFDTSACYVRVFSCLLRCFFSLYMC